MSRNRYHSVGCRPDNAKMPELGVKWILFQQYSSNGAVKNGK